MKRARIGAVVGIGITMATLAGACGRQTSEGPKRQPFEVVEASIAGIQSAIREGRTTCHDVVAAYLARIAAYDKSTGLNAITVINPKALALADEIDARVEAGAKLGPLFCAPFLVKDNFNTRDLPTTGGSITLKDNVPPTDAFLVARIRAADAILIAKTNMAEWAFSPRRTESSSFGVTKNAYALDRVPAGSSGGTASAVAASFGVAGLGSDTGNSIRGPSSHLSLFGIRSTIGLTSRAGIIPLAFDRDIGGPMTRNVEDAARIFSVIAGYDPADPFTAEAKGRAPVDYTRFLDKNGLKGARIGVLRALVNTDDADPEVINLFARALRDLRAQGAQIVDPVDVAGFEEHVKDPGFCPRFRYDMYVYLKSLGGHAPFLDVMEAYKSGRYSPYTKDAFEFFAKGPLDVPPEKWKKPCPPYLQHKARRAYLEAVTAAMDAAKVDVLVYPTWTNPPAHLDRADEEYKGDNSQLVAPATGMPAATVPMGFTHGALPAGLQILARRFDEGKIFKIAYAYEQATHRRRPPAGLPPLRRGTGGGR
jgi:amidase